VGSPKLDSATKSRSEVSGPSEVSLEKWVSLLRGQQVVTHKDGTWFSSKFDVDARDPWIDWNAQRDAKAGRPLQSDSTVTTGKPGVGEDSDNPWAK